MWLQANTVYRPRLPEKRLEPGGRLQHACDAQGWVHAVSPTAAVPAVCAAQPGFRYAEEWAFHSKHVKTHSVTA